jgi:hypothetical protein
VLYIVNIIFIVRLISITNMIITFMMTILITNNNKLKNMKANAIFTQRHIVNFQSMEQHFNHQQYPTLNTRALRKGWTKCRVCVLCAENGSIE